MRKAFVSSVNEEFSRFPFKYVYVTGVHDLTHKIILSHGGSNSRPLDDKPVANQFSLRINPLAKSINWLFKYHYQLKCRYIYVGRPATNKMDFMSFAKFDLG